MYELEYCLHIVENQISDRGDQMKEASLNNEEKKIFERGNHSDKDMKEQQRSR